MCTCRLDGNILSSLGGTALIVNASQMDGRVRVATLIALVVFGIVIQASQMRKDKKKKFRISSAPLGLYDGRPWFLPFAGMWHKILDWVE